MLFSDLDYSYMREAIRLAERGCGLNHPNPLVGAVIVKDNRIIGQGYHLYDNIEHAEPIAIRQAGTSSKGSTLYVNLEPCSHVCRTPPCIDAIIGSGIKKVIYSVRDPDERVNGKSEVILKTRGIEVEKGLLKELATELNRDYLKAKSTGIPWVVVKTAMSLDGKTGLQGVPGEYFSCRENQKIVHEIRAWCDGIMVGAGTVRIDNPRLTCRLESFEDVNQPVTDEMIYPVSSGRRNPTRIIISKSLDIPVESHVFDTTNAPTLVVTSDAADDNKINRLKDKGVSFILMPLIEGEIDVGHAFKGLVKKGIMSVMVEGGGRLIGNLVKRNLVDEMYISIAPILLGGTQSPVWIYEQVSDSITEAFRISEMKFFKTGVDILVRCRINSDFKRYCHDPDETAR
jgi:diaminohydroxyphosphoribosylaminopyrimidine deaminase/5-amino-6-(5-phosphoribosylamino)uracil reductase